MNDPVRVCILVIASPLIYGGVVLFGLVFPALVAILFITFLLLGFFKPKQP